MLALEVAAADLVPQRSVPWDAAQTAVAGFVTAIFSFTAGVWTFALRESRARSTLLGIWGLCVLIGFFGSVIAWGAASQGAALPYVGAAAVLLVINAPRRWLP